MGYYIGPDAVAKQHALAAKINTVIQRLEQARSDIVQQQGLGQEKAVDTLDRIIQYYRNVKRTLDNMPTSF